MSWTNPPSVFKIVAVYCQCRPAEFVEARRAWCGRQQDRLPVAPQSFLSSLFGKVPISQYVTEEDGLYAMLSAPSCGGRSKVCATPRALDDLERRGLVQKDKPLSEQENENPALHKALESARAETRSQEESDLKAIANGTANHLKSKVQKLVADNRLSAEVWEQHARDQR